jgi:apolipoprotein N-acyltransferase
MFETDHPHQPPPPAAKRERWADFARYPLGTALFLLLAFPRFDVWPLAWVALVPLLYHLGRCARGRTAVLSGFTAGMLFFLGLLYWIPRAMMAYGGVHPVLAGAVFVLVCVVLGLFVGAFAWLQWRMFRRWGWKGALLAPFAWAAVEYARNHLALTGFPWGNLGTSQAYAGFLIQIADTTGVYGVSFLVAAINTVLLLALVPEVPRRLKLYWAALVGMALFYCLLYAELRYATFPAADYKPLAVAGIQANIRDEDTWAQVAAVHREDYPRLVAEVLAAAPDTRLVVFPESPSPYAFDRDPGYRQLMTGLAVRHRITLLFNGIHYRGADYFNSVYAVESDGRLGGVYDKARLVPFAEHVPFQPVFFFARAMSQEISNFTPGPGPLPLDAAGVRMGVSVCYEAVFPEYVRGFTAAGARVLVNVTNDAWFGRTAAPWQHVQHSLLRAVENRRWVVRVANSGISAIIDPFGRVTAQIPPFARGTLTGHVHPLTQRSPYVVIGDAFAWVCVAVTVLGAGIPWRRKQHDEHRTGRDQD